MFAYIPTLYDGDIELALFIAYGDLKLTVENFSILVLVIRNIITSDLANAKQIFYDILMHGNLPYVHVYELLTLEFYSQLYVHNVLF